MTGLMTQSLRRPASTLQATALPKFLMTAVQNVLSRAWQLLQEDVKQGRFSICDASEDQITARLYDILGELDAAGENAVQGLSDLQSPVREGNMGNFNNQHPDKQPDLAFRPKRGLVPTTNTGPTAVFIECKPIDARHPVASTYCSKGLVRFVNGDYASGVDRGMMVGYVRNICTLPTGLAAALENPKLAPQIQWTGLLEELPSSAGHAPVAFQSSHTRAFSLPGSIHPAGPIAIHHLWLHTAEPCELSRCRSSAEV